MTGPSEEQTANSTSPAAEPHFLEDDDVSQAFKTMLHEFERETDRGAVLVAADIVGSHLALVIEELAPAAFTSKRLRELLNYPGLLSNLAARADVALMAGFIEVNAHASINTLRQLRNAAAHSQNAFRLKDNLPILRKISDLGPGVVVGVNQFANEAVIVPYLEALLAHGRKLELEIGRNLFPDGMAILDELRNHPEAMEALEERALRTELAFAIWILLGMVAHRRKWLKAKRLEPAVEA